MKQLKESFVEGRIIGQTFAWEPLDFHRSIGLIEKLEVWIDSEIFEIRPNSASLVVLCSLFIKSKESADIEEAVIVVVIVRVKWVDFILVSFGDSAKTGTGEIVALIFAHESVCGVSFKNGLKASDNLGMQFTV